MTARAAQPLPRSPAGLEPGAARTRIAAFRRRFSVPSGLSIAAGPGPGQLEVFSAHWHGAGPAGLKS